MLIKNITVIEEIFYESGINLADLKACDDTRHRLILVFCSGNSTIFDTYHIKCNEKWVFSTQYYRNYRYQRVDGKLLYIIIFIKLEKNSENKIVYIISCYFRKNGNNGNNNKNSNNNKNYYYQTNQKIPYRRKPLYIIIILNFEKGSKIKISYIITLYKKENGYNGYIYNKIEILYLFLFQEALYA